MWCFCGEFLTFRLPPIQTMEFVVTCLHCGQIYEFGVGDGARWEVVDIRGCPKDEKDAK